MEKGSAHGMLGARSAIRFPCKSMLWRSDAQASKLVRSIKRDQLTLTEVERVLTALRLVMLLVARSAAISRYVTRSKECAEKV